MIDIRRFSRLGKLPRVTVWVGRFLHNLRTAKSGAKGRVGELEGQEIGDTQRVWIDFSQAELQRSGEGSGTASHCNSKGSPLY